MGSLRLEGITKRYGDIVAVDDIDLDIEDGEFVSLVGPSGCGKSSTLETIAGLTKPTDGTVYIADQDVTDLAPKDRDISMVFQNIALFPHMNVFDNISYGLRVRGFERQTIEERVEEAVEILQLDGMVDRKPSELSGGQRQRVAIGRAIVRDPEVFLMDEPLANLDAKLRVHMRTELQRIQRQLDVTTVYVTHDQEEAMTMSDRIAILSRGVLQQIATPVECYEQPANLFVAGFIGSPSMNFLDGVVEGKTVATPAVDLSLGDIERELPDGSKVRVGIRPEDVYFARDREEPAKPSASVEVTVDVIEPVGHEAFVYFLPGEDSDVRFRGVEDDSFEGPDQLLMRTESTAGIEEGDRVEVAFDRVNVHLFDAGSGDALVHGIERRPDPSADTPRQE